LHPQEAARYKNALLFLKQTVAPGMNLPDLNQRMKLPVAKFDEYLWGRVQDAIDGRDDFKNYPREHPEGLAEHTRALQEMGR
jgi:hypothetical protein